jgi:hypothetical protein
MATQKRPKAGIGRKHPRHDESLEEMEVPLMAEYDDLEKLYHKFGVDDENDFKNSIVSGRIEMDE